MLRKYLDAWLPILSRWNKRIVFVDGFAGPGEYEGGEEGSPLVALRALKEHVAKIRAEVVFFFIENRDDRCTHLRQLVDEFRPSLPPNATVEVVRGDFDQSMTEVLDQLDQQQKMLAPTLVMIDPFGVSGTPMEVIARILRNAHSEVYISFMFDFVNRFLDTPEFEEKLDSLYGTHEWSVASSLHGQPRRELLLDLYRSCLKKAGAEHVVRFDLYEEAKLVYSIFFGTQHSTGCDRMKAAIWSVAPFGDFSFRGSRNASLLLGVQTPAFEPLRRALCDEFAPKGWVTIGDVKNFVGSDATEYHCGQLKTPVLKPMEKEGLVEVDPKTRTKRWTFPDGTLLRFKSLNGGAV